MISQLTIRCKNQTNYCFDNDVRLLDGASKHSVHMALQVSDFASLVACENIQGMSI
jgi:hypothetical protein